MAAQDEHDGWVDDGATWVPVPDPPSRPSDWEAVVHRSELADIQRLGLWQGGEVQVASGVSPARYFRPVGTDSLGTHPARPIYVVVHGWAPGYRAAVDAAGGRLVWWGSNASDGTRWASDWAWSKVVTTGRKPLPPVEVNPTGMLQQIHAFDRTATILAFSWIDDSASSQIDYTHMPDAYESEAYTDLNGIRLANALDQAIDHSFFANGGELRLIGHSHGSKVCTVAARSLAERHIPAERLTILDSPDSWGTRFGNASNLLGFHLERLAIRDPLTTDPGMYVESDASCFGVSWTSAKPTSPLHRVVNVALNPDVTYEDRDYGNEHTYAAAWYGGAAAGAEDLGQPAVGLAWPPVPQDHEPAMLQQWRGHAAEQWHLGPGTPPSTCRVATVPLKFEVRHQSKGVASSGGTITFSPVAGQPYSILEGAYRAGAVQYGFGFDLTWAQPASALFVVTISHLTIIGTWTFTSLVLDGRSIPAGTAMPIAICSDIPTGSTATVLMYYLGEGADPADVLTLTNIRSVDVT